jgi:hypothetical protein
MIPLINKFLSKAIRITNACASISFLYFSLWLSSAYPFSLLWFLLGIPIIYISFWVIELLFSYLIYRFGVLRRWILGKHFIEGYWIEILYDKNKMESMAILQIVFEKNLTYLIKGESYTLSGEYRGSFTTPNTSYHEKEFALRYAYSGKLKEVLIAGTGILAFKVEHHQQVANFFEGHLIDNFHVKGATFQGEKINNAENIASLKAKKEFMQSYLSQNHEIT